MAFATERYDRMRYNRCGRSGLLLPAISLGCWNNFGGFDEPGNMTRLLRRAFDLGITHFDLANNYGPPPGSAEENVGRILAADFKAHRDELIVSTKAGYSMWDGPYGDFGSKKYLVASLDQSLKRLGLDYVDIFYHHRPDPNTPLEETLAALDLVVRQGKALYAGVSNYGGAATVEACQTLAQKGTPLLINQMAYSMLRRGIEKDLLPHTQRLGVGVIAFVPLAQGLLTNKYADGIPDDSRAAREHGTLARKAVTEADVLKVRRLGEIAAARGQSTAQMALSWVLRDGRVCSALIGARTEAQLEENAAAAAAPSFSEEEISRIESVLAG